MRRARLAVRLLVSRNTGCMKGSGRHHKLGLAAVGLVGIAFTAGCALGAEEERYPSPEGDRTLIIRRYADWIDPMYPLELQHGWVTKDLGCVNGDYSGINSVVWLDNATLLLNLSDGGDADIPVLLRLDGDAVTTDDSNDLLHSC